MKASEFLAVLNRIAATGSRNEKEEILLSVAHDPFALKALQYAYDPHITFGITPTQKEGTGSFDFDADDLTDDTGLAAGVWTFLDDLRERRLTGGAAQAQLGLVMSFLSIDAGAVLWRILSKDMRCGITEKTVNLVRPGTIPTFDVMLAHKFEPKRIKAWPVAQEPKLDGVRVICLVRDGVAKFYSRTGKPFPALDHLGPAVAAMVLTARAKVTPMPAAEDRKGRACWSYLSPDLGVAGAIVLDGEMVSGNFNKTVGDVRRKDEAATDATFHIFDAIPYQAFMDIGEVKISFRGRRAFLQWLVDCASDDRIKLSELKMVNSVEEVQALYQEHRDRGLEGSIVKPLDAFYKKSRSYAWLKMKNEETLDLRITGAFEGTGKYEGMLGGLIVDCDGVEVSVGGGFSDRQREEFWEAWNYDRAHPDFGKVPASMKLHGRLIEVEFHEKTPDGSLRHPRFIRFRDDKDELLKAA